MEKKREGEGKEKRKRKREGRRGEEVGGGEIMPTLENMPKDRDIEQSRY